VANTYTQIHLQFVFAVENRQSLIQLEWKGELYKYITGIIHNNKHKLLAINGMPDHIHIFIGYNPNQLIPDLLKNIKGYSSKWINEKKLIRYRFEWQSGYGAFSYSHSQIGNVINYIMNQENHHKRISFQEEYLDFLKLFNVQYDEKYILKEVK
jgi:putative transposase